MTIEEAIKRYNEACANYAAGCMDGWAAPEVIADRKENYELFEIGRDAIIAQQERDNPQPQWVSVVDRLPEKFEKILAYTPAHKDGMNNFAECLESTKGMMVLIKKSEVTHWMPLPEPPKEEKCTQA